MINIGSKTELLAYLDEFIREISYHTGYRNIVHIKENPGVRLLSQLTGYQPRYFALSINDGEYFKFDVEKVKEVRSKLAENGVEVADTKEELLAYLDKFILEISHHPGFPNIFDLMKNPGIQFLSQLTGYQPGYFGVPVNDGEYVKFDVEKIKSVREKLAAGRCSDEKRLI